ncbi:MAG: hypothetical protein V3S18_04315 [Dehalococcoidia bacterium]
MRMAGAISLVGFPMMVGVIVDATGSYRPVFLIAAGVLAGGIPALAPARVPRTAGKDAA